MDVTADSSKLHVIECDATAIGIFEGETPNGNFTEEIDKLIGGTIKSLFETGEFTGKNGETAFIHNTGDFKSKRILLLGLGKPEEFNIDIVRKSAGAASRFLRSKKCRNFTYILRSQFPEIESAQAAVEGAIISEFDPDKYHTNTNGSSPGKIEKMILTTESGNIDKIAKAAAKGVVIAESINFSRHVINEPSNLMTPSLLADRAKETASDYGLEFDVLDEKQMAELRMGALLGVGQGSEEPPRLIVLRYTPADKSDETIAIVGKGITFDTGGISIKPSEGMEKMKYDMAGGATTIGIMRAIAQLKPSVNVIGIVPAAENMPSGRAQRPGDVVTSMAGKTIEVINTDAEGRLVLCDAITYAKKLGATKIIDMATLTGAVTIALGDVYTAIMGTDQTLINQIIESGKEVGEKFWQLPLDKDYREQIKSEIADIKNVGGRKAGTITAAYFLREFVEDTPWAHLDIAGTAWNESAKPHLSVGPSGITIRTLVNLLCK